MQRQYPICLYLLFVCILITKINIAQSSFIQGTFQKDTINVKEVNRIQNNIFSITSTQYQKVKIVFSTADTDKITIISNTQIDTTVYSNSIAYFPIYYKILNNSNKEWNSIQVKVYNDKNNILKEYSFKIYLKPISNWGAFINQQKYYILPATDTQELVVNLYNEGNTNETIKYTLSTLSYYKKGINNSANSILLPANQNISWHLKIPIQHLIKKNQKIAYTTITLSNEKDKTISFPITILKPSNTYIKENNAIKEGISIQTELNQIWRDNMPQTTAGINGRIGIDSAAHVDLLFKQYSLLPYQKNYFPSTVASIAYEDKNASLYAGNILEVNDFFIDGWGLRFRKDFESSGMGFSLAKDRIQDAYFTNWQWKKDIIKHSLSFIQQLSTYSNVDIGNQSVIPKLELQWVDSSKTNIKLFIGGSRERIAKSKLDTLLFSSMQGYYFSKKWKTFIIQSSLLHHGKNYAGLNGGLDQHSHSISFEQKPFIIQTYYISNNNNILYANDSALYLLQNVASSETGISVSWSKNQVFWQLKPSIFTQYRKDTSGLHSTVHQLYFNSRWYRSGFSFSLSGNIGVNEITQQFTKYSYVHTLAANIENKNTGLYISWDKGPYYYYDTKQFSDYPQKLSRVYGLLYRDWSFGRTNFSMRSTIGFQSDQFLGLTNFRFAHQLQYIFPKLDASIRLLAEWNTTFKYSNSIELNLRKNWAAGSIKSLFTSKKHVTLFKDENGNSRLDDKELLYAGKPVWINDQLLITNAKGQVAIKPSDIASYKINLNDVETDAEWSPQNGYEQQIKANTNMNIAFAANGKVEGSIDIIKAKYKFTSLQLMDIKIYIQNEFNRFAVVTDINGKFSLAIPSGTYTVSVDISTLSENLDPVIAKQELIIVPQKTSFINIPLKEKERTINIKQH